MLVHSVLVHSAREALGGPASGVEVRACRPGRRCALLKSQMYPPGTGVGGAGGSGAARRGPDSRVEAPNSGHTAVWHGA